MLFMKNLHRLTFPFFLCLLFLASCAAPAVPFGTLSDESHGRVHTEAGTERAGTGYRNLPVPGTPFQMISSPDITSYGSGNSSGYYGIYSNPDGSRNILYTDYETASQVYLCNQPSCAHNTESCASWLSPNTWKVIAAATDEHLFLLHSDPRNAARIECCDLNGANRRTIHTFGGGASIENTVAANDRFLIVCTTQVTRTDEEVVRDVSLQLIEIETGQVTTLLALSGLVEQELLSGANMRFLGLCETGGVLDVSVQHPYVEDPNDIEKSFQNQDNAMIHTIYVVPFDGTPPYEILSYPNGTCAVTPEGGWVFALRSETGGTVALDRIAPQTGEAVRLVEDFRQTFLGEKAQNTQLFNYVFRNYVDGNLVVNVRSDEYVDAQGSIQMVFSGMLIDTNSGEVREMALTNSYHATTIPVEILAHCGDRLLVMARIKEIPDPSGITGVEREAGLISVADYLHSEPNFQMIQSIRSYD